MLRCLGEPLPGGGRGDGHRRCLVHSRGPVTTRGTGRSGPAAPGPAAAQAPPQCRGGGDRTACRRPATGPAWRATHGGVLCGSAGRGTAVRRRHCRGDRRGQPLALLVDGHCHLVLAGDVDRPAFELACSEADLPPPPGVSYVDSQLGLAVRRWCPPALDLPAHIDIEGYLDRRAELGWSAATAALLRRAELGGLLVDTGLDAAELVTPAQLSDLAASPVCEVVRLERVAEQLAERVSAAGFADEYRQALADRTRHAVAVKSIIAYRHGLAIPPKRPTPAEVRRAAGNWLRTGGRLLDPVLLGHVLWAGVDTGLPLQLHTGFGDRDLALTQADPALAQPFIAALTRTGVPVVLLHCYPYHRSAGW